MINQELEFAVPKKPIRSIGVTPRFAHDAKTGFRFHDKRVCNDKVMNY